MSNENLSQPNYSLQDRRIHPALHFEEDFASVGIVDDENKYFVVTSDREAFCPDRQEMHLEPSHLAYPGIVNRWDGHDVNEFLDSGAIPEFGETVNWIKDILNYYCEFRYTQHATVIACWIVGTYLHRLFAGFPRLFLQGERGTAKSKVLSLIAATAFNGLLRLNPTPPTLFRLIDPIRPTLCLDEAENLSGHDRVDLLSILNDGYKRGAAVDRCVGDQHVLRSFQVYTPIALAGIEGLNRTTEDRALCIVMVRGRDREKINREVVPEDELFSQIRARCYRLALSRFNDIRKTRHELLLPDWLKARHRELWLPLFTIASLVDRDGDYQLSQDLEAIAYHELPHRAAGSLETERALNHLRRLLQDQGEIMVRPIQFANALDDSVAGRVSSEKAGHILRRLGFERRRDQAGTYYVVTREQLDEIEGEP